MSSKNDNSWEKIFEQGQILNKIEQDGFIYITPNELKILGDKRESRLLAKHDSSDSRPQIFKKYQLSILPVQNIKYFIFKDTMLKTYYNLTKLYDKIDSEVYHPVRDFSQYQTINYSEISTESQAIDFAYLVSLIKSFTGETELFLTIRGRQRSENFNFNIPVNHNINISGVQIQVDAGYESPNKIYIL